LPAGQGRRAVRMRRASSASSTARPRLRGSGRTLSLSRRRRCDVKSSPLPRPAPEGRHQMEIFDGPEMNTRTKYEIETIVLGMEPASIAPFPPYSFLNVTLEPAAKGRRKHGRNLPARLIIGIDELKTMVDALTNELHACHRVLEKRQLWEDLAKARKQQQEAVASANAKP
jgi:hypothetical protein